MMIQETNQNRNETGEKMERETETRLQARAEEIMDDFGYPVDDPDDLTFTRDTMAGFQEQWGEGEDEDAGYNRIGGKGDEWTMCLWGGLQSQKGEQRFGLLVIDFKTDDVRAALKF